MQLVGRHGLVFEQRHLGQLEWSERVERLEWSDEQQQQLHELVEHLEQLR